MAQNIFEKTTPESVGVNSKRIINFIERLKNDEIDMHSILLLKDNKLICEAYYSPFTNKTLHRMFSVTKSFVSLAIGILADKKIVDLNKPITDYFPEYEPNDGFHPYLLQTTILDLLMMKTPHNGTTFNKHLLNDWTKTYFEKVPTHRPGTIFSYDTSATHVLTALVEKLSGLSLVDFLRKNGFHSIGFSGEAYCITDGVGTSQGGSGLMAYPYDLLIVADMVMKNGLVDGKQIVSEQYIKEATSYQTPSFVKGGFVEEMQGYGLYFWKIRNDGFMMYGMAGQLAVFLPKENLILVTTADETDRKGGVQQILDAFWQEIYNHLNEENKYSKEDYRQLTETINNCSVPTLKNNIIQDYDDTFEFDENPMGIKKMRIVTNNQCGKLVIENEFGKQTIKFGFGSMGMGSFTHYNCPYIASGSWVSDKVLVVKANLIGEYIGKVIIQVSLEKQGFASVFSRKTEEVVFNEYAGFAQSL